MTTLHCVPAAMIALISLADVAASQTIIRHVPVMLPQSHIVNPVMNRIMKIAARVMGPMIMKLLSLSQNTVKISLYMDQMQF